MARLLSDPFFFFFSVLFGVKRQTAAIFFDACELYRINNALLSSTATSALFLS